MTTIADLTQKIIEFRDKRDWKQFHNPKDVALSLALEAAEVLEHFQWKNQEEIKQYSKTNKDDIGRELADVLNWILVMSHDLDIDILSALEKKIEENEKKYPIEKARGKHTKYDKL